MSILSWVQDAISNSPAKSDETGSFTIKSNLHSDDITSLAGKTLKTSTDSDAKSLAGSILANHRDDKDKQV